MKPMRVVVALALVILSVSACGDGGEDKLCEPDAQEACSCADGRHGTHACAADGMSWGACDCPCVPACTGKQCGDDGCDGSCGACDQVPADRCLDDATARVYAAAGSCQEGACEYSFQDQACGFGCEAGACRADPCLNVDCSAPPDPCLEGGTCVATPTVHCEYPQKSDGAPCDDALYCNGAETCQDGTCQAGAAIACASLDSVCATGVCDEDLDDCRAEPNLDGTGCEDGLFCNGAETCQAGACAPGVAMDCSDLDEACKVGDCSESLDRCVTRIRQNGTPCPDALFCNGEETCSNGVCRAASALDCTAEINLPCYSGVCNEDLDACEPEELPDGAACEDGDSCTGPDTCLSLVCQPGPEMCDVPTVVMVYLDGDNDLDDFAVEDFEEMKAAGVDDFPWLQVYALFDRSSWGSWEDTRLYQIHSGAATELPAPHLGLTVGANEERNMADPATLKNFILDVKDIVGEPANYYLVLWDHGAGWRAKAPPKPRVVKEMCYDETSGSDALYTKEIAAGIQGEALTLVSMDACLMGMVEVAYEIRNDAAFMLASEELEPGAGWDYATGLRDFGADLPLTPESFGRSIADSYVVGGWDDTLTLALCDLGQLDALAHAASAMADALTGVPSNTWDSICDGSEWFGDFWGMHEPHADLYRMAQSALTLDAANAAVYQAVLDTLDGMILYERHLSGHPNAHGLAIYNSCDSSFDSEYGPGRIQWAEDTTWDEMLQAH